MPLSDDFAGLRKNGTSDTDILNLYKKYDPSKANDIDGLLKSGTAPAKVVDLLGQYDTAQRDSVADHRTILGALREGASDLLSGPSTTLKVAAPESDGAQYVEPMLDGAAQIVKDPNYVPASKSMDPNSSWGQWFKALPYRVLESAPGMGQDLAAGAAGSAAGGAVGSVVPGIGTAAGGVIGGIGGFGASYLSRSFGHDAVNNAAARGVAVTPGDGGPQPSTSDKERALAQGAVGALLSRVGVGAATGSVVKAGESALPAIAAQVGKGAAVDAAASAGGDLAHQALTPGFSPGNVDTNSLLNSAATGALQGGVVRSSLAGRDLNLQNKHNDISAPDPEAAQAVSDRLAQHPDLDNPEGAYNAIQKVNDDLQGQINHYKAKAKPVINALNEQSGFKDDTGLLLDQATKDAQQGNPVDPDTLSTLRDRLGGDFWGANLTDALAQSSALNRVKSLGTMDDSSGQFLSGLSGNPTVQKWVKPTGSGSLKEDALGLAMGAMGHGIHAVNPLTMFTGGFDPTSSVSLLGAQTGLYGAFKGIDALMGNDAPVQHFVNAFSGQDGAPAAPDIMADNAHLPAMAQVLADQKAADAAIKQNSADPEMQARIDRGRDALDVAKFKFRDVIAGERDADTQARNLLNIATQKMRDVKGQEAQAQTAQQLQARNVLNVATQKMRDVKGEEQDASAAKAAADKELNIHQANMLDAAKGRMSEVKAEQRRQDAGADARSALAEQMFGNPAMRFQDVDPAVRAKAGEVDAQTRPIIAAAAVRARADAKAKDLAAKAAQAAEKPAKANPSPKATTTAGKAKKPSAGSAGTTDAGLNKPTEEQATERGNVYRYTPDGGHIIVTHRGQTVSRPAQGVQHPERYADAIGRRMEVRHDAIDEAKRLTGHPSDKHALNDLHTLWNQGSNTWNEGYGHMEDIVNNMQASDTVKSHLFSILSSPKVRATWSE